MTNRENADFNKIVDELSKLKPEVSKMIMSDKVTNSAIQQELKDGDIDRTISNHAQMMSKAYDNFSSVPLISGNYDYLLFIMLKEVWADIPVPYGSDNFIK